MVDSLSILSLSEKMSLLTLMDMPIQDGAFIEPITVGLHAFHLKRKVVRGKTLLLLVP